MHLLKSFSPLGKLKFKLALAHNKVMPRIFMEIYKLNGINARVDLKHFYSLEEKKHIGGAVCLPSGYINHGFWVQLSW